MTDVGDILVALSHSHFRVVMPEILGHLKALAGISRVFVFTFMISWGYSALGLWDASVRVC